MKNYSTVIIDNYDSFTFNLYQYLCELKANPIVIKNNHTKLEDIKKLKPTHLVISPGPGTVENPKDFGICMEIIQKLSPTIPTLGVCLGHQGIAYAFGGKIESAPTIIHGKQSEIIHNQDSLFVNVPNPFKAMRYHSLCVSQENFPAELKIIASDKATNCIMALKHIQHPIYGIQFHPESIGTPDGKQILQNFLTK